MRDARHARTEGTYTASCYSGRHAIAPVTSLSSFSGETQPRATGSPRELLAHTLGAARDWPRITRVWLSLRTGSVPACSRGLTRGKPRNNPRQKVLGWRQNARGFVYPWVYPLLFGTARL